MRPFGFLHRRRSCMLLVCSSIATANAQQHSEVGIRLANIDLEVEREADAQDCPDADQLAAALSAPAGLAAPPVAQQIHVNFSRSGGTYGVQLSMSGWRSGRRVLATTDTSCAGVARAAMLAISILLDPKLEHAEVDAAAESPASPPEPPRNAGAGADRGGFEDAGVPSGPTPTIVQPGSPPAAASVPRPPAAPPIRTTSDISLANATSQSPSLWSSTGVGVASDFSRWEALAFELGLRWRLARAGFEIAGFVTTPDVERDSIGESRVMFMGAHGRVCVATPRGTVDVLELNVCGQLSAAAMRGWAKGYDELEGNQYRPWLAAGPMAQIAGTAGAAFGWRFTLAVPIAITRESYIIDSPAGVYREAFTTEPWSFWLGASALLPIF